MPKVDYDLIRFGDKDDKLNRKESAILITDYLLSQTDSKVIAINSAWGTGKTWFVHMWKNELRKNPEYHEKVIPIYYNAWENDDYGDAFIPLLAAINEYLPDEGNKKETYLDVAKELFVSMISGPLKKMTFDMVDGKEIKEIYDKYKESLGSDFELAISDFQKQKELKENFSNALKEFTLVDKEEQETKEEKIKKIFIFIDELDRCRPTFAIETLERIKHYFGIENVHFILMQDSEQLSHSVKVLYGSDCDSSGYLRRFIDIEFKIPEIEVIEYIELIYSRGKFKRILFDVSENYTFTLRDCNKLIEWFNLFDSLYERSDYFFETQKGAYLFVNFAILNILVKGIYKNFVKKVDFDIEKIREYCENSNNIPKSINKYINSNQMNELLHILKLDKALRSNEQLRIYNIPRMISIVDKIIYY